MKGAQSSPIATDWNNVVASREIALAVDISEPFDSTL
jgi:hypothetical protein